MDRIENAAPGEGPDGGLEFLSYQVCLESNSVNHVRRDDNYHFSQKCRQKVSKNFGENI